MDGMGWDPLTSPLPILDLTGFWPLPDVHYNSLQRPVYCAKLKSTRQPLSVQITLQTQRIIIRHFQDQIKDNERLTSRHDNEKKEKNKKNNVTHFCT